MVTVLSCGMHKRVLIEGRYAYHPCGMRQVSSDWIRTIKNILGLTLGIRALLLYPDRLVIVADGYGVVYRTVAAYEVLLSEYRHTRILVYNTSALTSGGNVTLIGQHDVNGAYSSGRAVGSSVHIVTTSTVSYIPLFARPFDRMNFPDMTDDEYVAAVRRAVETEAIPLFVKNITEELTIDGQFPNISRLSMMLTKWNSSLADKPAYEDGVASFYVQVSSFDVRSPELHKTNTTDVGKLVLNMTAIFLPFDVEAVYAAVDTMVIATSGLDYAQEYEKYREYVYMLVVDLSGPSSAMRAVGQVPGLLVDNYSIDVMDGVVRIGTTDKRIEDTLTKSTNYFSTLQLPTDTSGSITSSTMEIVGQIELDTNEAFTFIRFFDNIVYAIAHREYNSNSSTFYAVDLSDPADPQVLGVFSLLGVLDYLYPVNEDNSLLIAVGQEAKEVDTLPGFQISVLDARDPAKPTMVQRYTIPSPVGGGWVDSFEMYGYKSFRYDHQGERLIIPIQIVNFQDPTEDFEGYYAFVANENEITLKCRISSTFDDGGESVCYYCGYLPWRSMIFDGNVTTLGQHFVRSTNLNTCANEWNRTITIPDFEGFCA
jgi:hypothetical protein